MPNTTGLFCAYCGGKVNNNDERCPQCTAPVKRSRIDKADPYFCNGYIIYAIHDWHRDSYDFIFYKGAILEGRISVDARILDAIPPQFDWTPTIMEYFYKTQPEVCPHCGSLIRDGRIEAGMKTRILHEAIDEQYS